MSLKLWALAAVAGAQAATIPADTPYGIQLGTLAQRYFRLCRAERLLLEAMTRQFNEKHLPMPPTTSFRASLPPAERRDAELVCLGAALQQFDDEEERWKLQQRPAPPPGATPAQPPGPTPP